MTLLFLTVMPSPYQRQLFSALAKERELAVRYFVGIAYDRQWELPDLLPHEKIMDGRTLSALGPSAHWNPSVIEEISSLDPQLVIVSDYSAPTAQLVMRVLPKRQIPFFFWGEVPGFSTRGRIGKYFRERLQAPLRQANAIAAIGKGAVSAYESMLPGKPIFNIPYFCDLSTFLALRQLKSPKDNVDVLFSGQMIERKGVDLLIDAFANLAPMYPELRLKLMGNGRDRKSLEARVPEELNDRVFFLGHKNAQDIPSVFAEADIFCLPSRHDGWGVVVNEALGSGLPIVVSDAVGAGHDLIERGKNGFVTTAGEVQPLILALKRLLDDPELRLQMGNRSVEIAQNWGIDEGVRRWQAATETILSASKPV